MGHLFKRDVFFVCVNHVFFSMCLPCSYLNMFERTLFKVICHQKHVTYRNMDDTGCIYSRGSIPVHTVLHETVKILEANFSMASNNLFHALTTITAKQIS